MIHVVVQMYRVWKWVLCGLFAVLFLIISWNGYAFYHQTQKQEKERLILQKSVNATMQEKERLDRELETKKSAFAKSNIDLNSTKEALANILKSIEQNGFFKTQLKALQESKNFINVAISEVLIKTNLIKEIARIEEFEEDLRKEFLTVVGENGYIEFEYPQEKEVKIKLIIIKKGE